MIEPGVTIRVCSDLQMVSVHAVREGKLATVDRANSVYRLGLRAGAFRDVGAGVDALGIGRNRWMFIRYAADDTFVVNARRAFEGTAAVCDQSDAYVVFEVAGRHARAVLAKGVTVDLHPGSFTTGDIAVTNVAHINVILWQIDPPSAPVSAATARFCLAVPRSCAESFQAFLSVSAA